MVLSDGRSIVVNKKIATSLSICAHLGLFFACSERVQIKRFGGVAQRAAFVLVAHFEDAKKRRFKKRAFG